MRSPKLDVYRNSNLEIDPVFKKHISCIFILMCIYAGSSAKETIAYISLYFPFCAHFTSSNA